MPATTGKKNKHPQNSMKARTIQRQREGITRNPIAEPKSPELQKAASVPVTGAPVQSDAPAKPAPQRIDTMEYPYLPADLKKIGILAAIILVVLIVLSIVIG